MTNIVRFPHHGPGVYDMMPEERIRHLEAEAYRLSQSLMLVKGEMDSIYQRWMHLKGHADQICDALCRVDQELMQLRGTPVYGGVA